MKITKLDIAFALLAIAIMTTGLLVGHSIQKNHDEIEDLKRQMWEEQVITSNLQIELFLLKNQEPLTQEDEYWILKSIIKGEDGVITKYYMENYQIRDK